MKDKFISKKSKSLELYNELEKSIWLRNRFGLPMDYGVVSTQKVTNGYGETQRFLIRFDGELIETVTDKETIEEILR